MNRTLIIVEDDDTIRENLRELLEMEDYFILEAENGKVALDTLRKLHSEQKALPFVILLDLNMPVMSGREFLIAQRADPGPISKVPVIITTAAAEAPGLGTRGFLRKPIDLDQLLIQLTQICSSIE